MDKKNIIIGAILVILIAVFAFLKFYDFGSNKLLTIKNETLVENKNYDEVIIDSEAQDNEITLRNMEIGVLTINGGRTIILEDCKIGTLIVNRDDGTVLIVLLGDVTVDGMTLASDTNINGLGVTNNEAIPTIEVNSPSGATVNVELKNVLVDNLILDSKTNLTKTGSTVINNLIDNSENVDPTTSDKAVIKNIKLISDKVIEVETTNIVTQIIDENDFTVRVGSSNVKFTVSMLEANLYRLTLANALKDKQIVTVIGKDDLINSKSAAYTASVTGTKDKVTVTFNSDGGSKVASKTIDKGSKVTKPTNPTKSGYKFLGWYVGNTTYNFNTVVNKDLTLVAKWQVVSTSPTPTPPKEETPTPPAKSQDQINMDAAKNLSITVSKGGVVPSTIGACTVSFSDTSAVAVITRDSNPTYKSLTGTITCGALSEIKAITVVIPASPYSYTIEGEQQPSPTTYLASVSGVSTPYTFGKVDGLSYTEVGPYIYSLQKVRLVPKDWNYNVFITHVMRIESDLYTLYKVGLSN